MTPSIRTFLLINLLLSVTLITSLAIIGNLFLAHKDIQTQLDAQLIRSAERTRAFFSDYGIQHKDLSLIQRNLLKTSARSMLTSSHFRLTKVQIEQLRADKEASNHSEFQIWNNQGKLLLHSAGTPTIPFSNGNEGLSTLWLHGESWRVNTLYDPATELTFMVAERSNYRQQLENQLAQDSIFIMLITYPFLGFLIWIIVGRGLDTLKKVAKEVRHRAPAYLEPVDLEAVPSEIEPLVSELNNLFGRLKEAFEREKRCTADAAHELRTPLAALNTHTQVALRAKTPEERKEALLKVLAGVNRGTHVVQQLLTLNRMVPEATLHEQNWMDLGKEAADIAAQLAPEAIAKNIDLELITPDDPPKVKGNNTAISILIRNMVDNAIRYSPEKSKVTIRIEKEDNRVILRVIDNGPGIPEELRERVFERFFRMIGNQATGSGLGLSIVLQIAKLHNAEIALKTPNHGKGLDFWVTFPLIHNFCG
ncbi:ATP-binding protein [Coxiella burnetii]|uniref:ATP-binding protein n=1 Tax=Coxiella burnetii TaxID=777 RepID=UPI002175ECB2|nr:ATP-binding protein [Coxiella burnetii]